MGVLLSKSLPLLSVLLLLIDIGVVCGVPRLDRFDALHLAPLFPNPVRNGANVELSLERDFRLGGDGI